MSTAVWLIGIFVHAGVQTPSPTPPPASFSNIYRASVEDAIAWMGPWVRGVSAVIEVDPRILNAPARGLPIPGTDLHPAEAIAGAAVPGKVIVVPQARAEQCKGLGMRTCRKDGLWVGFALEAPVVTGDTATVKVLVRISRQPTEEQLARLRASANPEAALKRYGEEAGNVTLLGLSLVRKDGVWSVVARKLLGQS